MGRASDPTTIKCARARVRARRRACAYAPTRTRAYGIAIAHNRARSRKMARKSMRDQSHENLQKEPKSGEFLKKVIFQKKLKSGHLVVFVLEILPKISQKNAS